MITDFEADLLETAAIAAAQHAYCPYSKFHVGAAVLLPDHSIILGCNVENASYGLTICSERNAIFQAVARGHKQILALAVACPDAPPDGIADYRMPCGACRQVMAEFMAPDATVIVVGVGKMIVAELLPRAFRLSGV